MQQAPRSTHSYILTADDYGLAREFNRGILELAHQGALSGISIMIRRKFIRAQDLLSLENIDLGLHLELDKKSTKKEIKLQIEKFRKKFGRLPDYLDGHKHRHLTETNLPKVIAIAKKYSLPVRSRFLVDRTLLRQSGILTPDNFISWHPERKQRFFEKLQSIKGTTEIVCHPGYFDSHSSYPYNERRKQELTLLKSSAFKKTMMAFILTRYSELS